MSHEGHIPETRPGGTVIQGPVLEVPMVLGHAIDVTPTPHVSDAFLGDSRVNRSLPLWRKAVITGTAFVAGVTAAGVTPKPAEANGFILTGSTASSECIDDSEVYVLKREPGIAVGNTEAQLASIAQPQTGKTATADQELPQDIEIAILPDGSRLLAVAAEACENPIPSATPNRETAVSYDLPKAGEVMEKLLSLKEKEIRPVKLKTIQRKVWGYEDKDGNHVPGFWDKYSTDLEQMHIILWDNSSTFTKQIMREELEIIGNTSPLLNQQNDEAERKLARLTEAGLLTVMFLAVSNKTENPELQQDSQDLATMVYSYGMKGVHPNFGYSQKAVEDNMLLNGPKLFQYNPNTPTN